MSVHIRFINTEKRAILKLKLVQKRVTTEHENKQKQYACVNDSTYFYLDPNDVRDNFIYIQYVIICMS